MSLNGVLAIYLEAEMDSIQNDYNNRLLHLSTLLDYHLCGMFDNRFFKGNKFFLFWG